MKDTHYIREIERASKHLVRAIQQGWTAEEAFEKIENSYNGRIAYALMLSLNRNLNK